MLDRALGVAGSCGGTGPKTDIAGKACSFGRIVVNPFATPSDFGQFRHCADLLAKNFTVGLPDRAAG